MTTTTMTTTTATMTTTTTTTATATEKILRAVMPGHVSVTTVGGGRISAHCSCGHRGYAVKLAGNDPVGSAMEREFGRHLIRALNGRKWYASLSSREGQFAAVREVYRIAEAAGFGLVALNAPRTTRWGDETSDPPSLFDVPSGCSWTARTADGRFEFRVSDDYSAGGGPCAYRRGIIQVWEDGEEVGDCFDSNLRQFDVLIPRPKSRPK